MIDNNMSTFEIYQHGCNDYKKELIMNYFIQILASLLFFCITNESLFAMSGREGLRSQNKRTRSGESYNKRHNDELAQKQKKQRLTTNNGGSTNGIQEYAHISTDMAVDIDIEKPAIEAASCIESIFFPLTTIDENIRREIFSYLDNNDLDALRSLSSYLLKQDTRLAYGATTLILDELNIHVINRINRKRLDITRLRVKQGSFDLLDEVMDICPNLKTLDVSDNIAAPASIIAALQTLQSLGKPINLEELDLAYTQATADDLNIIVQTCPLLKKLSVFGNRGSVAGIIIALQTLQAHAQSRPFKELNLSFIDVTTEEITTLQALVPQCHIFSY